MAGFESPPKPRFIVESGRGSEKIVVPAGRNWFVLLFLPFWLILWTAGGIAAFGQALTGNDTGFLVVWLCFWAVGWIFAASWLGWQISGKELIAVEGGALVRGWSMLGLKREKRYDLTHVDELATCTPPFPYNMMRVSYPPFFPANFGPLKWNYGASTIYAASGLSEAEAKMIIERLRSRLPARLQS